MRFHFLILSVLLTGCSAAGCSERQHKSSLLKEIPLPPVVGGTPLNANRNSVIGYPKTSQAEVLISREEYLISWNAEHRELNWSAWQVTPGDLGHTKRSNNFAEDPDLEKVVPNAVLPSEYKGSCFDRGHQTPSGDRTDTAAHNSNTFYMSNMIPQTAYLNRIIWEHLENHERELAREQTVFIFAGPIFSDTLPLDRIGPHADIAVPTKNFKVIADASGKVLLSVIMPNVTSKGTNPVQDHVQACADSKHVMLGPQKSTQDWVKYTATIADIEQQAHLKFDFLNLD
jgi:DNA/RNA endonuclease G (NUC1)